MPHSPARIATRIILEKYRDPDSAVYHALRSGIHPRSLDERIIEAQMVEGNVILDIGANAIWRLVTGIDPPLVFNSDNACIGVGDSDTPEDPSQTGLYGPNVAFKGMDEGYPVVTDRSAVFRSTFGPSEALFYWREVSVTNTCGGGRIYLNRRVVDFGEKKQGETWSITVQLTIE